MSTTRMQLGLGCTGYINIRPAQLGLTNDQALEIIGVPLHPARLDFLRGIMTDMALHLANMPVQGRC